MTLYILIVEDEADFIDELRHVLAEMPGASAVQIAKSRTSAFEFLEKEFFDLIILDLNIPTIDGALDTDPLHGHAVFAKARSEAPGTPILVLTGSPAEDFIPALLRQQQQIDIWGEGRNVGTIDFLKKYEFDDCPARLKPVASAIDRLGEVELDRGQLNLAIEDDRLIRIFARKFGGTRCVVSLLGGGLSGAKVVRLRVTDSGGVLLHDAVAKLGTPQDIRNEGMRFDNQVSRLDPSATPRKLATLDFGARAQAGIFYGLADPGRFNATGFEVAKEGTARSGTMAKNIEGATKRWIDGVSQSRRTIKQIRQRVLADADLAELKGGFPLGWVDEFESHPIQTRWACIHGDLHGSNILVSADGAIVLIDYGDVGEGPASLDPVTLELSLLFHPQSPLAGSGWPSQEEAAQWGNLDEYLRRCPSPIMVSECRQWALRVAAGNREIAASAYGYLVRQLKYKDTDKNLVLALLDGVRSHYGST
jgi:CheY-like chemotaxis protein